MTNPKARLLLLVAVTVTACTVAATLAGTPAPTTTTTTTTVATTTTTTTTTTTVAVTVTAADTTVEPTAPPLPVDLLCPEWRPILVYVGFTGADLETADRVLWAESRCRNEAVNDFDCHCAFQIHRPSWQRHLADRGIVTKWELITTDPVICAAAAYHIATNYGWQQWSTF